MQSQEPTPEELAASNAWWQTMPAKAREVLTTLYLRAQAKAEAREQLKQ